MMDKRKAFGEELAGRRAEKGVSLEEMARVTKVRRPILEALEAGRFEDLPPEVFTLGFLKVYASHLGINPAVVVSQYKRLTEPPVAVAQVQRPGPEAETWIRAAGVVLVLALLAGVAGWLWWSYQEGRWPFAAGEQVAPVSEARQERPAPAPEVPRPADRLPAGTSGGPQNPEGPQAPPASQANPPSSNPEPSAPPPAVPATAAPAQPAAVPGAPPATVPKGDVVLTCSESCWLEMWADGKRVVYRQVTAGERLAFDGQRFRFNIGNASGLQVYWRGQPVVLPQDRGRVVKDFTLPPPPQGAPAP